MSESIIETLYQAFLAANQRISTDTRHLEKGAVFFALKGGNFDGNTFAQAALAAGCSAAVIDSEAIPIQPGMIKVPDVLTALQALATHHRRQFKGPVLAITGSNGKTTTKELVNAVLSQKYNTLYTHGNLNNHIGVPLTLLRLTTSHTFAIIEMGANHQGEINQLCRIAEPTFGMISNIGKAHLEGFGGIEGVKKGKSEMYRFLEHNGGLLFVNGDDGVLMELSSKMNRLLYGSSNDYYLQGTVLPGERATFQLNPSSDATLTVQSHLVGSYNVINCLAAAAIGRYFGVTDWQIQTAIEGYVPEMNRSQMHQTQKNTLILDAYNANPNSMKAAIENFAGLSAVKKLALLGDMFELGEYSAQEHQNVADLCAAKGVEAILVGPAFAKTTTTLTRFETVAALKSYLQGQEIAQFTILIKGSRGMKMEQLQDVL
jgi:UDP-N-acetylmuramoyl-tripeptide--D-alanyl-D-alanine ligase